MSENITGEATVEASEVNVNDAIASAESMKNDIGVKGFLHAFNIMRYTYDSDKRTGRKLYKNRNRVHITEWADRSGVSGPTVKNYRIGYEYARTVLGVDLPENPDADTAVPEFKGATYNAKAWSKAYSEARAAVVTKKAEEKEKAEKELADKIEANPDGPEAVAAKEADLLSGFAWVGTAIEKAKLLIADAPKDLSVEKAEFLMKQLGELSNLVLDAGDAVKKFAPVAGKVEGE